MSAPVPPEPPDPTGLERVLTSELGPPVRKRTRTGSVSLTWYLPVRDWVQTRHRYDVGQPVGTGVLTAFYRHYNAANEYPTGPAVREVRTDLGKYSYTQQDVFDRDPALLEPWEREGLARGYNHTFESARGIRLTVVLSHRAAKDTRVGPKPKHPRHQHDQFAGLMAGVTGGLGGGFVPYLYRWDKKRNRGVAVWVFDNRGRPGTHLVGQGLDEQLATIKRIAEGLPGGACLVRRGRYKTLHPAQKEAGAKVGDVFWAEARVYLYPPPCFDVDWRPDCAMPEDTITLV